MSYNARLRPITNASDWSTAIQINDKASGTPIDLSGDSFTLNLWLMLGSSNDFIGYGRLMPFYDWSKRTPDLIGSTASGELTTPSLGIIQIYFPVARIQGLHPGSYALGMTVTNGVMTAQVAIGLLPIVSGNIGLSPF